jgi:hypothetical protein
MFVKLDMAKIRPYRVDAGVDPNLVGGGSSRNFMVLSFR